MNYSADKPIVSKDEDLLGRSTFSNKLAKAIYEYNDDSGLVIGLFGKWGTGKTSVINMAEEELLRLSKTDDNKPLFVKFSPWNYSDQDNLISLFFHSLNNKLQNSNNEKLKGKIGDFLKNYADAVDGLAVIPTIGPVLAPVLKTLLKVTGDNFTKAPDLDESKEKLKKALLEISSKIVVVIDDIDRLNNSQIRDIFQLVKQVGDFPNVIYVLLMDREVVSSALKEVHNIDGNEYLDKIIQVPFEIPDISKEKLYSILQKKIKNVYENLPIIVKIDQTYMRYVLDDCVYPYVKTLRDVNRIINIFQFKYGALYEETAFEDMLALTTIEVKEPKLYKWIYDNKDNVCGGVNHAFFKSNNKDFNYSSFYEDEFTASGINSKAAMNFLKTMFPIFADDINENVYRYVTKDDTRAGMRISHEEKFDLYFSFDIESVKVPRKIINASIYEYDEEKLYSCIKNIIKENTFDYFLYELLSLANDIPDNSLELIASTILILSCGYVDEDDSEIESQSDGMVLHVVYTLLNKIKLDTVRSRVIISALNDANRINISEISTLISRIEYSYGRLDSNEENPDYQLVSIDQLKEIENVYVKSVRKIINSETISNINNFSYMFSLWNKLDSEEASKYLKKLFDTDLGALRFICTMAVKCTGNLGNRWDFSAYDYKKYISSEEIYNIINNIEKNKLNELTELERLKVATFFLNYTKDKNNRLADEKEARELLFKWKETAK